MTPAIPVTLLYGGLTGLLLALLGLNVSLGRRRDGVGVGGALEGELLRRARAHGNAAEWVPPALLMLLLLELSGVGGLWLHLLGGTLFFARVLHAGGVYRRAGAALALGAGLTYGLVGGMAIWAVVRHFTA